MHIPSPASTLLWMGRPLPIRADAIDGALWQSNGPVYDAEAFMLAFATALSVFAMCYLLVRIARRDFVMPADSKILFELDWIPNYKELVRAFTHLYGVPPKPCMAQIPG